MTVESRPDVELPLRYWTPIEWAHEVLKRPLELLNDHAHLEKKAAANALDLLLRWPQNQPPEIWVQSMTSVANDEVEHLQTVTALLARRGGELGRVHANRYAGELRRLVRFGQGNAELVDRLIISALIEARSCERFYLLGQGTDDKEFRDLYSDLYASEAGHYRVFIKHAKNLQKHTDVESRWDFFLDEEAKIIQRQAPGPSMHSGL